MDVNLVNARVLGHRWTHTKALQRIAAAQIHPTTLKLMQGLGISTTNHLRDDCAVVR
jgi:hypothetical protein